MRYRLWNSFARAHARPMLAKPQERVGLALFQSATEAPQAPEARPGKRKRGLVRKRAQAWNMTGARASEASLKPKPMKPIPSPLGSPTIVLSSEAPSPILIGSKPQEPYCPMFLPEEPIASKRALRSSVALEALLRGLDTRRQDTGASEASVGHNRKRQSKP